ncbi:L-ribulose-5-phosphate 3-epimerase UlaE [bioreactor metagenome]|uniref:L-ribulose-5-phosphate 3-epimerase UlaE n=1 Tax=bioreactor metagenome TaxID=1076179 RepID=A0A645CEY2_9ZZZZ
MLKCSISVYGAHLLVPENDRTVANIVRASAGLGFDAIDLGYYWGENRKAEMAEIRKLAPELGIAVGHYIVGNNFGNAAEKGATELAAEIDKVKVALDEAAEMGCAALRIFGGGYELEWNAYCGKIAEALAACVDHAKAANVIMALEDHGALCKNSAQMLYYLTAVNSPWLRANVDIGNFWNYGELPETGVRAMAKYAAMVHVKDLRRINGTLLPVPVGEGEIDFRNCFRMLAEAGYSGLISLEYECQLGHPKHGIAQSLAHMRRCATGF